HRRLTAFGPRFYNSSAIRHLTRSVMTNNVANAAHPDRRGADGQGSRVAPQRVADALRTGRCPADRTFDRFLPASLRVISVQYWTPLVVAKRAAEWFDD